MCVCVATEWADRDFLALKVNLQAKWVWISLSPSLCVCSRVHSGGEWAPLECGC